MKKIKANPNLNIGFIPDFSSIGETIPILKIARLYQGKGGNIVVFSHGGKYEYLTKEINCKLVLLEDLSKIKREIFLQKKNKNVPFEKLLYKIYDLERLDNLVKEEIASFKKNNIDLILKTFNLSTAISIQAANIQMITLVSGSFIPPYFKSGNITFPENYENIFTRIIPSKIKNIFTQWYLLNNKVGIKNFNIIGKKYDLKPFKNFTDLLIGDHTLVCDDINILNVKPSKKFPLENFIGPIYGTIKTSKKEQIDEEIEKQLDKPGRSVLINLGHGCSNKFFEEILAVVSQKGFNIIAVRPGFVEKEIMTKKIDNVVYRPFIDSILELNKRVDLVISHGGRGTIYTSIKAGRPIIGIPMFIEHQYNIDNVVKKKSAIRVSQKNFSARLLTKAIDDIFGNYDFYYQNAQKLSKDLQKESGEEKAVERIIEISKNISK